MNYEDFNNLKKLLRLASKEDIPLYIVGGAVRNYDLELPIKDIDLATPALPAELVSSFGEEAKLINSAQAYPVVSFLGFEIASFRKDGANRADVSGISLNATMKEDAQRRDFTINALYAPLTYSNIRALREPGPFDCGLYWEDPTGLGDSDMDNALIRLIGNPEERLAEDPLRALRAYRFAATLPYFTLEPETKAAVDKVLKEVRMKV